MFTSSFGEFRGVGGVSIARSQPAGMTWPAYRALAPDYRLHDLPREAFEREYGTQLARLDAAVAVRDLRVIAGPHEPVLLCFESSRACAVGSTFCHRHQAAKWIEREAGIIVREWKPELVPGQMTLL